MTAPCGKAAGTLQEQAPLHVLMARLPRQYSSTPSPHAGADGAIGVSIMRACPCPRTAFVQATLMQSPQPHLQGCNQQTPALAMPLSAAPSGRTTAVLPKIPHSISCKSVPNRPLRLRRSRFGTILQQLGCGICRRTAVDPMSNGSLRRRSRQLGASANQRAESREEIDNVIRTLQKCLWVCLLAARETLQEICTRMRVRVTNNTYV